MSELRMGETAASAVNAPPAPFVSIFPLSASALAIKGSDGGVVVLSGSPIAGGTNLGSGSGIFVDVNSGNMEFKSLVAGSGITLTPASGSIQIDSTSSGASTTIAASGSPSLSGAVTLSASGGAVLTQAGQNIQIFSPPGVTIAASGSSALTGNVLFAASGEVSLSQSGQTITIFAPTDVPAGVTSLNSATGALTIAGSGGTSVSASGSTITVSSPVVIPSWATTGNAGLSATANFLGTTDATDIVVKTNSTQYVRVTSGGQTIIGPLGSATAFTGQEEFLSPNTSGYNNGLVIRENSKAQFSAGSGTGNANGWAIVPRGPAGVPEIRVSTNGGDQPAYIRPWDSGFGNLYGYFQIGSIWGFMNSSAGFTTLKVSGTTGQTVDIQQWSNQSDFGNPVSAIEKNGNFKAPAGSTSVSSYGLYGTAGIGMNFPSTTSIGWNISSAQKMLLDSTGLTVTGGVKYNAASASDWAGAAPTTLNNAIDRLAAALHAYTGSPVA